ncbi:MAG: hypothetical protein K0S44_819 [Bacteroidetes bacterium]|jgi:hypothetical protein|nr:hypothetical protein [Bacteroidota bacterium]
MTERDADKAASPEGKHSALNNNIEIISFHSKKKKEKDLYLIYYPALYL